MGGANGEGTVYKYAPATNTLTTLYSFCSRANCLDGAGPEGTLVQGADGNFYGTTDSGGSGSSHSCDSTGCGTVFKITPGGIFTSLYSFCTQEDCPDGYAPEAGLIQGRDGNLYGTTSNQPSAGGTVFKITPAGVLTTLASLSEEVGATPRAGLVEGADGNFYGAALGGGDYGDGSIFEVTPTGIATALHSFDHEDGYAPNAAPIQGTDGNLYATALDGGMEDCGTVFGLSTSGAFEILHDFHLTDGSLPWAGLVQDTNGMFYGMTAHGGNPNCWPVGRGCGTLFAIYAGLAPFVKTNPAAGKVGASVGILGTNLTGATGVKFDGTATAFRLVSSTFIEAKVPFGATSGKVQVQLPSGSLSSNVPFIVLH